MLLVSRNKNLNLDEAHSACSDIKKQDDWSKGQRFKTSQTLVSINNKLFHIYTFCDGQSLHALLTNCLRDTMTPD